MPWNLTTKDVGVYRDGYCDCAGCRDCGGCITQQPSWPQKRAAPRTCCNLAANKWWNKLEFHPRGDHADGKHVLCTPCYKTWLDFHENGVDPGKPHGWQSRSTPVARSTPPGLPAASQPVAAASAGAAAIASALNAQTAALTETITNSISQQTQMMLDGQAEMWEKMQFMIENGDLQAGRMQELIDITREAHRANSTKSAGSGEYEDLAKS